MIPDELPALQNKIAAQLALRPEYFVTHPAELRLLQCLTSSELEELVRAQSWRVIRRVGGRQFQFYNDTYARAHA